MPVYKSTNPIGPIRPIRPIRPKTIARAGRPRSQEGFWNAMTDDRKQLGADGERIVRTYLEDIGWRVLVSNFRCREGEIDIIAEDPSHGPPVLVFIEVKTRRGGAHGAPIEAVDARKVERLRSIALAYLSARDLGGEEPACRFDIAEVTPDHDSLFTVRLHRAVIGEN